jgi:hypothetical protein
MQFAGRFQKSALFVIFGARLSLPRRVEAAETSAMMRLMPNAVGEGHTLIGVGCRSQPSPVEHSKTGN